MNAGRTMTRALLAGMILVAAPHGAWAWPWDKIVEGAGNVVGGLVDFGGSVLEGGVELLTPFEVDWGPGIIPAAGQIFGGGLQTVGGILSLPGDLLESAGGFIADASEALGGIGDQELAGQADVEVVTTAAADPSVAGGDPTATPTPVPDPTASGGPVEATGGGSSTTVALGVVYTIRSGDTLGEISAQVQVFLPPPPPPVWGPGGLVDLLGQLNQIADVDMIFTGSPLRIPSEDELAALVG